jgi:hypothetical protein
MTVMFVLLFGMVSYINYETPQTLKYQTAVEALWGKS